MKKKNETEKNTPNEIRWNNEHITWKESKGWNTWQLHDILSKGKHFSSENQAEMLYTTNETNESIEHKECFKE